MVAVMSLALSEWARSRSSSFLEIEELIVQKLGDPGADFLTGRLEIA
jgi:hypothetical protein